MQALKKVFSSKTSMLPSKKSSSSLAAQQAQTSVPPVPRRHEVPRPSTRPLKIFADEEQLEDKLVGVVVTIYEGDSYDEMFREVRPVTVPGERVSTYSLACSAVESLRAALEGAAADSDELRRLVEDIRAVDADSVVINWECCSACGDHAFPGSCDHGSLRSSSSSICSGGSHGAARRAAGPPSPTMRLMGLALRSGYTVMCSDFSLKSLIHEWCQEELGPNPFLKVGECSGQFRLEFEPAELQHDEVPQQLQVVGELCASQGRAMVEALGGTIVYTVDPRRPATELYDLKVLTVVSEQGLEESGDWKEGMMCSVGDKRGSAGHVSLTYKNGGGQLITSNGHWIELTRIDASLDSVQRVAEKNFGQGEVDDFMGELRGARTESERAECVQKRAQKMINQSVACRMKSRTKYA